LATIENLAGVPEFVAVNCAHKCHGSQGAGNGYLVERGKNIRGS